jgi:hypothetical protein
MAQMVMLCVGKYNSCVRGWVGPDEMNKEKGPNVEISRL